MKIQSSKLQGSLTIPPSKSHTLRALIFGSMASGTSSIENLLLSKDTNTMIDSLQSLGAKISLKNNKAEILGIQGKIDRAEDVLNVGNSGIGLRFLTALATLSEKPILITGDHSIRHLRPMKETIDALTQLGAKVISTKGDSFAPLIIQGPITKKETWVYGQDSQHVSNLLILAMFLNQTTRIHVKEPGELPWIDLTLSWLDRMGVSYLREGYHFFEVQGKTKYPGITYTVPGDFSTAAFPFAAALVTRSKLTLKGLDFKDSQGDKKLFSIFQQMGAKFEVFDNEIQIDGNVNLHGMHIDIQDCIDALPILATVACFAKGKTRIVNGKIARTKECDRISCIAKELSKMGAKVVTFPDGLEMEPSNLQGTMVDTHHDHRIAMSLAIAGFGAKGITTIANSDCIQKTYPQFAQDFMTLGANFDF